MRHHLKTYTTLSILRSAIKIPGLASRAKELNLASLSVTESGNLYSAIKCVKEFKGSGVKLNLGCSLIIKEGDSRSNLTVLCKNLKGWQELLKLSAESFKPENYWSKQKAGTIGFARFCEYFNGNWVILDGSVTSTIGKSIFSDYVAAIKSDKGDYDKVRKLVRPDWETHLAVKLEEYRSKFGDSFYLEVCPVEDEYSPASAITTKLIRHFAKKLNIPTVGVAKPSYLNTEDSVDQRILLCSKYETNLNEVQVKAELNNDADSLLYFKGSNAYLTGNEFDHLYHPEELATQDSICSAIDEFKITSDPKVPTFFLPDGVTPDEKLKELCREGWKRLVAAKIPKARHQIYADRVKMELGVISEYNLSSYFLIVEDIIQFCRRSGRKASARGSCAGSIVSWLLGISEPNPIEMDLLFERFLNKGRMSKDQMSPPDIDIDVESRFRGDVLKYIKNKYGTPNTAQISNYIYLKGRSSLKDVLRAKSRCNFEMMNKITEPIPDEGKISDQLAEMKEEDGESSIILWALQNRAAKLKEWCWLDDEGNYQGDYGPDFQQAIRLEGMCRGTSKHAGGIVVSNEPLENFCALAYDEGAGEAILAWEMTSAEAAGGLKIDVLAVSCLDDMRCCEESIRNGEW